jgi:hypothetical protein
MEQMEHERYDDDDDDNNHCRWRDDEAKRLFDPKQSSSPSHDVPRNILMFDSPE